MGGAFCSPFAFFGDFMITFFIKCTLLLIVFSFVFSFILRICRCFSLPWPKFRLQNDAIYTFYGAPGSGKTTVLAHFAKLALRQGITVYSNVPIVGCREFSKDDFGVWRMDNCLILWDEVGVDANSRNFKANFTIQQIKFFKYHRHENAMMMVFSQGFDDADKIIRTLSTDLFVVSRHSALSPFRNYIKYKRIQKKPDIDEMTHKPDDLYFWQFYGTRRVYAPLVWPIFDSWTRLGLPQKPIWHIYGKGDIILDPATDDYSESEQSSE